MMSRFVAILSLFALTGCATAKFTGQVVSCADQKPINGADLKWTSKGLNDNMAGNMPPKTDKDGKYTAKVTLAEGNSVTVTVDKAGFEPKEEIATKGAKQQICLNPKK
jgi:hypothetical protein